MQRIVTIALLTVGAAVGTWAQAPGPLPADIDAKSYSRLSLVLKDSLDAGGKDSNVPRLGPPNNTMYSMAAAEPYDQLNQVLRKANVVGAQFFEISTLVPAREFNQQYEWSGHEVGARRAGVDQKIIDVIKYDRRGAVEIAMMMGDYAMTAMVLNAADRHLPPNLEPLLPPR